MRDFTKGEINALEDMISSEGWKILVEDLKEKERIEIEELLTISLLDDFRVRQARIVATRKLMNRPKDIIRSVERKNNEERE